MRVASEHHSYRDGDSITIDTPEGQMGMYFNARGAVVVTGNAKMAVQTVGFGETNRGSAAASTGNGPGRSYDIADSTRIRPSDGAEVDAKPTTHPFDTSPTLTSPAITTTRISPIPGKTWQGCTTRGPNPQLPRPIIIGEGPFTADQVGSVVAQVHAMLHRRFNTQMQKRLALAAKLGIGAKIWIGLTWVIAGVALGLFTWQRLGGR